MKNENIPNDINSKSIKDTKDEINEILRKLEDKNSDLETSKKDYDRLIKLSKHMDNLFKKKPKDAPVKEVPKGIPMAEYIRRMSMSVRDD